MSRMDRRTLLTLFICCCFSDLLYYSTADLPCERILFKMKDSKISFPYEFLEGVYSLLNASHDGFYRYKMEGDQMYLQYSRQHNLLYFASSDNSSDYVGVRAFLRVTADDMTTDNMTFDSERPYDRLIDQWQYYAPRGERKLNRQSVDVVCVTEERFQCSPVAGLALSIRLVTQRSDGKEVVINNPLTDRFVAMAGVASSNRPVYKHSGGAVYLFHAKGLWVLGPDHTKVSGYLKCEDPSRRPEFATAVWYLSQGKGLWKPRPDISFRCKGVDTPCQVAPGTIPLCQNKGRCLRTAYNESFCFCGEKFSGEQCASIKPRPSCPVLAPMASERAFVAKSSRDLLAVASLFCARDFEPEFVTATCLRMKNNPSGIVWYRGRQCLRIPTIKTPTTTTYARRRRSIRWSRRRSSGRSAISSENTWVFPTVLTLVIVLQICLPIVHWVFVDISLCRVLSIDFFVSLLLWSAYLVSCSVADCRAYDERLFRWLKITGLVIIALAYVIILIESCFSNEREYLGSVMQCECAQQFIDRLRGEPPCMVLSICCWHYETRTRVVYYTDANGNQQSRIETYQERVNTYAESETFPFRSWRDTSAPTIPELNPRGVTRLKLTKDVEFGDAETANQFNDQKTALMERNRHRDVNIDFDLGIEIAGFKERLMGYVEARHVPWWLNMSWYWIASFLGLTWPYRLYMKYATGKAQYFLKKEVFSNAHAPDNGNAILTAGGHDNMALAAESDVTLTNDGARYNDKPPSYEHAVKQQH